MREALAVVLVSLVALPWVAACRGAAGGGGEASALAQPPLGLSQLPGVNVLVVSFDALRADALGLYGNPRGTSPNLDRFAQSALVFENAFVAAPVTPTSFAAVFSGRHPHEVFLGWKFTAADTLAGRFSEAGYRTAAFLNNVQLTAERGFDRGFQHYAVDAKQNHPDALILEDAVGWLARSSDRPFFAWVHFLDPHAPYERRDLSVRFYDSSYEGGFAATSGPVFDTEDPREIRRLRDLYEGEVYHADLLFGVLRNRLEDLGLLEDTVVVVTADHGEEFRERGVFQHRHLHDETLRVPLLIYHPGEREGRRIETLVSNLDLYPTLLAIADLDAPSDLDGHDLLQPGTSEGKVVSLAMTDSEYRALSVRTAGWKLILECRPETSIAVFDLEADPGEVTNRVNDVRPEARRLLDLLRDEVGGAPCQSLDLAVAGRQPTQGLASETVESLRSLGYLDP